MGQSDLSFRTHQPIRDKLAYVLFSIPKRSRSTWLFLFNRRYVFVPVLKIRDASAYLLHMRKEAVPALAQ